jgi:hypothetical protein
MTDSESEDLGLTTELIIFPAFNLGNSELCYFLKSLSDDGLLDKLLLICSRDFFTEFQSPVQHCIIDEFTSFPTLVKKIEAWGKEYGFRFKGVLSIDEELQFKLSKSIARHFGLEFHEDLTCFLASNKFLLKTFFQKYGVPSSGFSLLSTLDPERIRQVGFPNVLKVISGSQSQYIFYNENMKQLKKNFSRLKHAIARINGDPRFKKQSFFLEGRRITFNPKRQFLLEAYTPGEEYSCDFILQSHEVQLIRVAKKIQGPYFGYFNGYQLLNEEDLIQNHIDQANLVEICRRISQSLGLHTGLCMVDFKVHQGKISVLESSIRPGLSAFNHLMYAIYGYTSLALLAMQKMGMKISVRIPDSNGAVVYIYTLQKEIHQPFDTSELEKLKVQLNILYIHKYEDKPTAGMAPDLDHSRLIRGYVLVKNPDKKDLAGLITLIHAKARLCTTELAA